MSKLILAFQSVLKLAVVATILSCSISNAQGLGSFDLDPIMKGGGGSSSKDILGKRKKQMSFSSSSTKSKYSSKPKGHEYQPERKYTAAPKPDSELRKFSKAAWNASATTQVNAYVTERVKKKFDKDNVKFWKDVFRSIVRFDDTTYKGDTAYVYVFRKKPSSMVYHKGRIIMKYERGRWKADSYRDTHWFNQIPN